MKMDRTARRRAALGTALTITIAVASVSPVRAAVRSFGSKYKVTATMIGAQNMQVLLVSAKGQTLASASVTKKSQKVTLSASGVSSTKGATIQLISGTSAKGKGAYYGPVVLGWKGAKSSLASKVTSKMKASTSSSISLGSVQVRSSTATAKQGYAVALAAAKVADTSTAALAKAYKGKPAGVGNYGKSASVSSGDFTVSIASARPALCPPAGNDVCPPPGNTPAPGNTVAPGNNGQPANNAAAVSEDDLLGGDKDDDGIPNAFDVDDDGDAVVDGADADTPAPKVGAESAGGDCAAQDFKIFTNLKATDGDYAGTLNAYGSGNFQATGERSAAVITKTMTMVFQPIAAVCNSPVTARYLKGNGVPYAPADYVKLGNTCGTGDYQWYIGAGRMCDANGGGAGGFDFGSKYVFSATDLPTGQDTFTMKVETADGNSYEFTSSPGFVFVTHPMLVSYDNGAGYSGTIPYGTVGIPPIKVTSAGELTLTMFRPQRLAFDGEPGAAEGAFYDLAAFKYTPDIPNGIMGTSGPGGGAPLTQSPGKCDALTTKDTAMSNDTRVDTAAKPMITMKWRLSQCLTARSIPWTAGFLTVDIQVEPTGPGGNSAQKLWVELLP